MVVKTLIHYYRDATPATRRAGERWYADAKRHAERLAKRYNVTVEQAAGIIAVLSQRQRWERNLLLARDCLAGERLVGIFGHQRDKAQRMRKGEHPLEVLRGPKIIAFYRAIMGDGEAIVLDTWMLHAMGYGRVTVKQYDTLADRLRTQAADVGTTPSAFQAVCWVQVRGAAQ